MTHINNHVGIKQKSVFDAPSPLVRCFDGKSNIIRCQGINGNCNKTFNSTSNFHEHWNGVHSGVVYACLYCGTPHTWIKNIRKHIRTDHVGRCTICDQEEMQSRDKKRKKEAPHDSSGSPGSGQNTPPSGFEIAYLQLQQAMQQMAQQINGLVGEVLPLKNEVLQLKKEVGHLTEFKKQFDSPLPPMPSASASHLPPSIRDPNMASLSIGHIPSHDYGDDFGQMHPDQSQQFQFRGFLEHERDLKRGPGPGPGPGPGKDIHSSDGVRTVPGGDGVPVSGDDVTVSGDGVTVSGDDVHVSGAGVTSSGGGGDGSGDGIGADTDKTNSEEDRSSVSDSKEMGSGGDDVEVKTTEFSTSQNARFQREVKLHLHKIYYDMSRISEKQNNLEFAGTQNKYDKSVLATYSDDQFYDFVENVANLRGEFLEKLKKATFTTSELISDPEKCLENIYRKSSKRSRKILCKKLREKFPDELPKLP